MDSVELARALADERRLRALSAVALGATSLDEIARVAALSPREAGTALHRLHEAGLLDDGERGWSVAHDQLRELARRAGPDRAATPGLSPFVEGRRLRSLPASRERRWVVLSHVATHALEAGRDYTEPEIVALLAEWCEGGTVDTSALRRYLVEERLVSRGSGRYRLGGDGPPMSPGEKIVLGRG